MGEIHSGWIALGAVTVIAGAVAVFARFIGPRTDSDYQILVHNITQMIPSEFVEFEVLVEKLYLSNCFNEYWNGLNVTTQDRRQKRRLILHCLLDAPSVAGESHSKARAGEGEDIWCPITFSKDPDEAMKLRESIISLAVEADIRLRFRRKL